MSCTSVTDSTTVTKKCGEIIITMKKNTKNVYSFSCWYCDTICLQMKKFTLHLEREHTTQLEASFTSSENNKQDFDGKIEVRKPAIGDDISVGEIKIEDCFHDDIKYESGEENMKIATIPTKREELTTGFKDPLETFEENIDEKHTIHFDNDKEDVDMHNLSDEDQRDYADLSGDDFSSDCDWKKDESADEAYGESVKRNTKAKEKKIILALIEEFHKRPQLWNTTLSAKCNLKQKEDLLQSITDALNVKLKVKLKLYMVKKKLNFICKQYEQEIERQLYENDQSNDADNSQLWFCENMSFLKTTIENKLKIKKKKPNHKVDLSGNAQSSTSEFCDASQIKSKIISGECKIVTKIGKSKVWDIFGEVEINGSINQKLVACRICNAVYRFNGTSILVKHKCYKESMVVNNHMLDVDQQTKAIVARAITHWTIRNCRPFKMVEDDGFRKYTELVLSIGAKYGREVDVVKMLPHPTTVSRNIDKLYGDTYNLLQSEITAISDSGFAITTDLWTDNYAKTSYLVLTIHFAKNAKLNTRLLGFEPMNFEACTKDKILKKVTKTLEKFQCRLDKGIIVTDMKTVFSGYNHIFCFDHLLHNIIEKAIKETVDIENLCIKCTKLLKYFKKTGCNAEFTTTTLKSFTPTRWNTIYFLLKSVHQNWTQIGKILQEKTQLHRTSGINVNVMRQVMDVLRGFAETSKKLEGDSYPTLHLALIHLNFLQRLCAAENSSDQDCVKDFKSKLKILLGDVVTKNLTIYHKIAVFLFPPTNKMLQFSSDEKQQIRQHCKEMMEIFANDISAPIQNTSIAPLSIENKNIFTGFLQTSLQTNVCDKIQYELSAYENVYEVLHDDFDVMLWWELNKPKFPLLYQVSSWILATPASSAPSERMFSAARNLISEERCVVGWNPASVEKIMFLHHNMKN